MAACPATVGARSSLPNTPLATSMSSTVNSVNQPAGVVKCHSGQMSRLARQEQRGQRQQNAQHDAEEVPAAIDVEESRGVTLLERQAVVGARLAHPLMILLLEHERVAFGEQVDQQLFFVGRQRLARPASIA